MKEFGPISLRFRRLLCRIFGHTEVRLSGHYHGQIRTGYACTRCHAARARVYRGQYPLPR